MENFNNDDVKKMLDMLREQAENTNVNSQIDTQTTENDSARTDDDIKEMLKKHFSAENYEDVAPATDDYSFDPLDEFVSDDASVEETSEPILTEEKNEEIEEEFEETHEEEIAEENEFSFTVDKIPDEPEEIADFENDVASSPIEDTAEENAEIIPEHTSVYVAQNDEEILDDSEEDDIKMLDIEVDIHESEHDVFSNGNTYSDEEEEPISEESINYDDVLEGQQGTVFNEFVEDFTGDLDDVVFEAEITESRAPDKQYTIFEDWEQIIKDKDYSTSEEEIIQPTKEELEESAEINEQRKNNTDYFNPIVSNNDLDAVDIALMVALGGDTELGETVGFEKIRQAVHDVKEEEETNLEGKKIYGFTGDEYTSLMQNIKIKNKYKSDKGWLIFRTVSVALLAIALLIYEILGWTGAQFKGALDVNQHPIFHVLVAVQMLVVCFAITFNKFIKLIKEPTSFSSLSYLGALITLFFSLLHDVFIGFVGQYASPALTFHSISAVMLLISLIYDIFDYTQQSYMFNIISLSDKKLVLEPYGKIKTDNDDSEIIESDSYCISRVPTVKKYFARTAQPSSVSMSKLIPLVMSFSVAMCVALLILLLEKNIQISLFSFVITISFLLVCTCVFESEFAFFMVHKVLKKYKTGIIGKSSVSEYGKCDIVYFDDYNVFNKKSVRTKGLKLYDNNEIYRILYHTQAVFSKVGGPLKGVFEFATSEMTHSKKVEIKEISNEGISAVVDGRTTVLIGTGAFMKSRYIHPSYTSADLKLEESGEDSIMFIALNGVLGAKLYVTYQFSSEFEKLARKLTAKGVRIGIRSADPNINSKWGKVYGSMKKCDISIVRPTLKEIKPNEKSLESGVVSVKNVRALLEALMMCIKLNNFESVLSRVRAVALVLMGILSFALVLLSGINTMTVLSLSLATALCASIMSLLTYFYIKN